MVCLAWSGVYINSDCAMYTVHMLQGVITVELYWKHAPKTCRNFAELVRECVCIAMDFVVST